jgi:hypothetical protein
MTWGDWTLPGEQPAYEAYTESVIDLVDLFTAEDCPFPYGLLRVADIRDEINFNTGTAISRVDRMAYSAENLAEAQATGRAYEYDTDYIYLERAEAISTPVEDLDGSYDVNDHGLEMFTNTSVAVYTVAFYGANLKNKLERDVLTKSQDLIDNLTTNDGTKALSAKQGKLLNDNITTIGRQKVIDWTADSSNATNVQLTTKATLNKGTYIAVGSTPITSANMVYSIASSAALNATLPKFTNAGSQSLLVFTFKVVTDGTEVWLITSASTQCTYTYKDRGGLWIIRVSA